MSQRKKCRKILNVDRLCVIPSSVGNLILTLFKENLTLFQIAEEVKYYPSIAARVLAIANSAWSSPAVPVTNLLDACVRLGIATVQTLSLALAVNGVFDPLKCNSFDARRYWMSAMLTSLGADLFAKALGYSEQASTWRSVGLLHNLSLLWMADHIPTETAIALGRSRDGSISLVSIMQDEIGMDYLLVGGCLAEYWLLPQIFRNVIFNIRHSELAEEHAPPARAVGVSSLMASALFQNKTWVEYSSNKDDPGSSFETELSVFKELAKSEKKLAELITSMTTKS